MYRFLIIFLFYWVLPAFVFSQVDFNKLEFRDYDWVYIKGDPVPFTGKCVGECSIFDDSYKFGKANYFFKLGTLNVLNVEGEYKDGKANGKWIYETPEGKLRGTQKFKEGKLNGWVKLYYLNGKLCQKYKMKNDKRNGMSYSYSVDGKITYKGKNKEGEEIKIFIKLPSSSTYEVE